MSAPNPGAVRSGRRVRPLPLFRRMTIVHGIIAIVVIIVTLQLWLFTATMNAYFGGDTAVLLPGAFASLACFGLNLGLLRYLYVLDR